MKNNEPIVDKNSHLSWYTLYDPTPDPTRQITDEDQFGKQMICTGREFSQRIQNVFRSVLLGSPCRKLDWKEV